MTATPTPLRELIREAIAGTPSLWDRPTMLSDQQFDDIAARVEAALSARDEAGCGPHGTGEYCEECDPATPPAASGDDFNGDNAKLIGCIEALLSLDAANALVPHGIGGHARTLLSAAARRLAAVAPEDANGNR